MFEPKLWTKPTNTKWLVKEISQYLDWIIKKVRMVSLKVILIKIQIVQQKNIRLEGDIEEINNYEL